MTVPLLVVYVVRRVLVDNFVADGAWTLSQADSAFFWVRLVDAFETWVTVTMPPNATSVAATAMIRRRPLNQPEFLDDARRYLDLRMWDTFLCLDLDGVTGDYLARKMRMVVMTPATRATARTRRTTVVLTPGIPLVLLCAAATICPSTGTGPEPGVVGAAAVGSAP